MRRYVEAWVAKEDWPAVQGSTQAVVEKVARVHGIGVNERPDFVHLQQNGQYRLRWYDNR